MRSLCHPWIGHAVGGLFGNQIRNRGCTIDTSHPSVSPSVKASLFWGAFEKSEVLFVQQFLPRQFPVIELGSGIGVVSSHIAKRMSPSQPLICVEANPEIIPWISRNVGQNSTVVPTVVHAAIAYSGLPTIAIELADRHIDTGVGRNSGSGNEKTPPIGAARRIVNVPVVTLGSLWDRIKKAPFCLVSDIEGAEVGILEQDEKCLASCQALIIELHSAIRPSGETVSVPEMEDCLRKRHQLNLVARRGDVFAFVR